MMVASQREMMIKPVLAQWLGLGFVLIALGGAIAFNLFLEHERAAARESERLTAQTRVIAENLEHQLVGANLVLEMIRDESPSWKGLPGRQTGALHLKAFSHAMQGVPYFSVLDAQGQLVVSNLPQFIGRNLSYRDYFKAAKQHPDADTLYVSPPFKSLLGSYVINVTRMVPGPHGEFAGIVTATLDPGYFKTLMSSALYAPDMWDAVAHGDGLLFLMIPERESLQGTSLARPGSFFSRHRDSGRNVTVFSGMVASTKEVRMIAQRTVHPAALKMDKPLVVATSRDLDAIFQSWHRMALAQAGLYGLIALISIFGLYAYQRRQAIFEQHAAESAAALRQSAERLQLATSASGVGVWDYDLVTGGLVWDDSMYALYAIDKTAVSNLYEAWHGSLLPEDRLEQAAALKLAIEQGAPYTPIFRIRRGDGAVRHIQARARIYFDADGKPVRLVGTNEDITESEQQKAVLQESEERFRSTFDSAAIGMALVSLEGRFAQVNNALCRIVGYTEAELQQKTFQDITYPDDLEADLALMRELIAGKRQNYQMEKRYFHKDGHIIWILLSGSAVRDAEGKILYFVAQIQDVTERKALLDTLVQQANQDYLTGLSNRRSFLEQSEVELARAQRYGHKLSLFMLDIDHFKRINDTHGHKAGDIVLQKLSHVLRETLRTVDITGRMGGEEFAILLPEADIEEAAEVAERLRVVIARTEVILDAGLPLHFTVSIGIATLKEKDANIDILLNLADMALYQAKKTGRNKVCRAN